MYKDLLTINDVAQLLRVHPQTVYRKVASGQIRAVRFGRTIRFRREDLPGGVGDKTLFRKKSIQLPEFLKSLFWDVDFTSLDPRSDLVIERILEFGEIGQAKWLLEHLDSKQVIKWIETRGRKRLSRKSLSFWAGFFNVKITFSNTSDGSTATLGETVWR